MKLYVDMDGVLADFDSGYENAFGYRPSKINDNADWSLVQATKNFYANLPPMPDLPVLWSAIKHLDPIILTGVPSSVPGALANKQAWRDRWLGYDVTMIGCASKAKCGFCEPGDVLIDDWIKHKPLWEAQGGRWITHVSAEDTIKQLKQMGVL